MKIQLIYESLSTKRTIATKLESLPSLAPGFVRAVHFTGGMDENKMKSILKHGVLLKIGEGEYSTNYNQISSTFVYYPGNSFWDMLVTKPQSHRATKGYYVIMDMPYNDWLCYDNPILADALKAVSPNHLVGIIPIDTENIDKGYVKKAEMISAKNPAYTYRRFKEHMHEIKKRLGAAENAFKKKVLKAISAGEDISNYMHFLEPFSYVITDDEKLNAVCRKYMEKYNNTHAQQKPEESRDETSNIQVNDWDFF